MRPGFAIDAAGDFYVTYEPFGHYIDEIEELKKEHEHPETLAQPCAAHRCFTEKLTTSPTAESDTAIAKLARENTTGLAVDASSGEAHNDVYIDSGSSVAAFTTSGKLIQRFASSDLEQGGGAGVAVDSATHEVLVADSVEGKIGRIESFAPEKEGPPVIEPGSPFFSHARSTSAALTATIDPNGTELSELHYYFQYGTGSCASSPESCTQTGAGTGRGRRTEGRFRRTDRLGAPDGAVPEHDLPLPRDRRKQPRQERQHGRHVHDADLGGPGEHARRARVGTGLARRQARRLDPRDRKRRRADSGLARRELGRLHRHRARGRKRRSAPGRPRARTHGGGRPAPRHALVRGRHRHGKRRAGPGSAARWTMGVRVLLARTLDRLRQPLFRGPPFDGNRTHGTDDLPAPDVHVCRVALDVLSAAGERGR